MRCPHCDKTIAKADDFCRHCGRAITFLERRAALVQPPTPGRLTIPIEHSDFGPGRIEAPIESKTGAAWGAHIYTGSSRDGDGLADIPEGCPSWVEKADWPEWFRRGLVVWDHRTHQIRTLLAGDVLELLMQLQQSVKWKKQGIAIIEGRENQLIVDTSTQPRRRAGKQSAPESRAPSEHPKPKFYKEERLRLRGAAAREFFAYLGANEDLLRRMANDELLLQTRASLRLLQVMGQVHHHSEAKQVDLESRKFAWIRHEYPMGLVCEVPPNRGTVTLSQDSLWWQVGIERQGHRQGDGEQFFELRDALEWVEQRIRPSER